MPRFSLSVAVAMAMLAVSFPARALEVGAALGAFGFPADTVAQVQAGQFVETVLPTVNERDLNVGIAFLVKQDPATLTRMLDDAQVKTVDPGAIASGELSGDGSVAQLAALKLTASQMQAFSAAAPGSALNLSQEEIAALRAAGKDPAAVADAVKALLVARYRAYRARGVTGVAPYARDGSTANPGGDLLALSKTARKTAILPASFHDFLEGYPQHQPTGVKEQFSWEQFTAHGADTIALVHRFQGTFDGTPIRVQRHYYVSTGYDVEQAIGGFLPLAQGTLVIYTNHTSTEQVAGLGGLAKRSIGRRFMAKQLSDMFEKARAAMP